MKATQDVLHVWRKFDDFPMETVTKGWYYARSNEFKQRSVELMKEHRNEYGTSGNCFDLALWLIDEFTKEGMKAYAVGHNLKSQNAHVAVVTVNGEGKRYFCDLGVLWINPIMIEKNSEDYIEEELDGFVTGGKIKVEIHMEELKCIFIRPNGKQSNQSFDLRPIEVNELHKAANASQNLLRHPLVEMRIYEKDEVVHWEFDRWKSFISSNRGLFKESSLSTNSDWADRINKRTGIDKQIIEESLDVYSKMLHN